MDPRPVPKPTNIYGFVGLEVRIREGNGELGEWTEVMSVHVGWLVCLYPNGHVTNAKHWAVEECRDPWILEAA